MPGIDATLERIYERMGWRIVLACQAFTTAGIGALAAILTINLGRVERWSAVTTLERVAGLFAATAVLGVATALLIKRSVRPLIAWLDGDREQADAELAWSMALGIPRVAARWNAVGSLSAAPVAIPVAALIAGLDAAGIAWVAIGYLCGVVTVTCGSFFTVQLASRPLVRDVARSLHEDRHVPPVSPPLRLKLLLGFPPLLVTCATAGNFIALNPGASLAGALPELAVTIGLGVTLAVPISLLFAYSIILPLDDLAQGTERLRQGDYRTPVPVMSADEHGLLASSLNDAMRGMAERERLASENTQLLADVTRLYEEVRASRARIIAASDAERRRVERNIHDGAQQQLVALAVKLRMLEDRVADDDQLRAAVTEIEGRLKGALDDLRELARGLHPSVLTTDGLSPALQQLAARAPIPVAVTTSEERFPEALESTAYFVACEALANIAKYARATHAEITTQRRDGHLIVEVADDGVGGAHAEPGSGLTGLVDRVAALDGTLALHSPLGEGTTVTVDLPIP